jgi:hypothetical protein
MTAEQTLYLLTSVIAFVVASILLVFAYIIGSWFIAMVGVIELAIGIFFGVKWIKLKIEID